MLIEIIIVIWIGLCLGSFSTALTYRIPRGQSWIATKGKAEHSACPSCRHSLKWFDLLPLISWITLHGQCRYCRAPIGWRYPAIELTTVAGCLAVYFIFGLTITGGLVMVAVPFLVAMAAIDLEYMILPDQINFILGILGAAYVYTASGADDLPPALLAAVIFAALAFITAALMTKILKKEAMGFGDVKFFAVAGLWLGTPMLPAFLLGAGSAGIVLGLIWKIIWKKDRFPFGPALIVSFFVCLLFLPKIRAFLT